MMPSLDRVTTFFENGAETPLQRLDLPLLQEKAVSVYVKRDDMIHPLVSGNKFRKLKYNAIAAAQQGCETLLSFGGAFSNHVHALAALGKLLDLNTIGVIRGEAEYADNPTLSFARQAGMRLHFVDRETYRYRESSDFHQVLRKSFGDFFLVPEGGSNVHALQGCAELGQEILLQLLQTDYVCVACGSGGTLAGICQGVGQKAKVLGFSVLKNAAQHERIHELQQTNSESNWELIEGYHFGGYAKLTSELLEFCRDFQLSTGISLDLVYTAKLFYAVFDLIQRDYFKKGAQIVIVHSGGLQGNAGMKTKVERLAGANYVI